MVAPRNSALKKHFHSTDTSEDTKPIPPTLEDSAAIIPVEQLPAHDTDTEDAEYGIEHEPFFLASGDIAPSTHPPTLLPPHPRRKLDRSVSSWTLQHETDELDTNDTAWHEIKRLAVLAIPLVAINMSSFLVSVVSLAFVGHLGKWELSVVVLAVSIFNVTGLSFLQGSLGALETLSSQAFGAKNYTAVGIALQRATLFTTCLMIIVSAMWIQAEGLFLILGQEPSLAKEAASYLHYSIPALWFIGYSECLKRYLTAQNIIASTTISSCIAMAVAPLANYVTVVRLKWGLFGAAMAMNCAQCTPFVVLLLWTVRREVRLRKLGAEEATWRGWSWEALRGWGRYLKLAGPSAAMVCMEWSTFEACVILSGLLSNPEQDVAVMGLMLNISGMLYMLPQGLGSAASVRVGNSLGAGLPRGARRAAYIATCIVMAMQAGLAVLALTTRHATPYIFTQDPDVVEHAAHIFIFMAWCMLGDGVNATSQGVLRGAGRQAVGAVCNLVAYWMVGLPLAALLAFKAGMGVEGLWIGLATCASLNGVVMMGVLAKMDWQREAQRALEEGREGGGGAIHDPPSSSSSYAGVEFTRLNKNDDDENDVGVLV